MKPDIEADVLHTVEAVAALRRAAGHATVLTNAFDEAGNALAMTDAPAELSKQLHNCGEWARMLKLRCERLALRLAEGAP